MVSQTDWREYCSTYVPRRGRNPSCPGRRRCLFATLFGLGCFCLTMGFMPKESRGLVLLVYVCGKYFAALSGSVLWLYTAELYPTNLRSQAIGSCSMISRY